MRRWLLPAAVCLRERRALAPQSTRDVHSGQARCGRGGACAGRLCGLIRARLSGFEGSLLSEARLKPGRRRLPDACKMDPYGPGGAANLSSVGRPTRHFSRKRVFINSRTYSVPAGRNRAQWGAMNDEYGGNSPWIKHSANFRSRWDVHSRLRAALPLLNKEKPAAGTFIRGNGLLRKPSSRART